MADIETSVAITASADGLQAGLASATDAVEDAAAAMRAQFADLGAAAQQAQAHIGAATAQIGSAISALQARTSGLAGTFRDMTGSEPMVAAGNSFPGISVSAQSDDSAGAETARLAAARDEQSTIDQDYYQNKSAAAEDDLRIQLQSLEQQELAYRDYLSSKSELDAGSVQDSQKLWQSMLQPIQRTLDTSITNLVLGTSTVQKAVSDLARSTVGEFVNAGVGSVFGGIGSLLGTGVLGAAASGGDQDFSAGIGAAGAGILGGGLFGSLFKGIGSLLSFDHGGIVPSAAGGWMVPSTSLALLHTNEMVLPADISQGLQSMIAGNGNTGPNITFAVSAMDAPSVATFFKNNGASLVAAINRAMRNGSALRSSG